MKGYVTEKIFDAFYALTIPIYWGAPNVTSYIPSNCFIDMRNFKNYDELYAFLTTMDEKSYNEYLTNIQLFLESNAFKSFCVKNVTLLMSKAIADDLQHI